LSVFAGLLLPEFTVRTGQIVTDYYTTLIFYNIVYHYLAADALRYSGFNPGQ